jgi:hypothetical protein
MGKPAIDGKRRDLFQIDCNDPRLVIIGIDRTDIYGAEASEKAEAHPLYDPTAFLPDAALGDIEPKIESEGFDEAKPIKVYKDGEFWLVVDGNRRTRSARRIAARRGPGGKCDIYCVPFRGTEKDLYREKMLANTGRRKRPPVETAYMADRGMKRWKLTEEECLSICEIESVTILRRRLKLLRLTESLARMVDAGKIPLTIAEELSDLPRPMQADKWKELSSGALASRDDIHAALRDEKRARKNGGAVPPTTRYPKWSHATMRKVAEKMEAGEIVVPGLASLSFAEFVRLTTGELDPAKVKGVVKALRAVAPKKKGEAESTGDGDAE